MAPTRRILVVDDEPDLCELVAYNLERAGYEVETASDGGEALDAVARSRPALIILDLMMPRVSGQEVARKLKRSAATSTIPIVMLTAKTEELDEVQGLELGADDYITKPFSMKVLMARVEAVLRRVGEAAPAAPLTLGPLTIDEQSHRATVDGKPMKLTVTEFRLLAALVENSGRVLSRRALIARAMGPGVTVTERTIDVHVTSIRKKLGREASSMIRTVRGVGYRATLGDEDAGGEESDEPRHAAAEA